MSERKRFYILAHPDDEIMCLPLIYDKGYQHLILYLTVSENSPRYREASKAIDFLKSQGADIKLIVNPKPNVDGLAHLNWTKDLLLELAELINSLLPNEIVSTHYEGGHQDHDTAFVIGFLLSRILDTNFISFSTYRKSKLIFPNFATMKAITDANHFKLERIILAYTTIRLIRIYSSQWTTWVGLGPFVIFRYLSGKANFISEIKNLDNIQIHNTYYEYRNRAKTSVVMEKHDELLNFFSYRR
jgi:hypothetical protein